MDEHLRKLPESFQTRFSNVIKSYNQQFDNACLEQYIDLIFECATSHSDHFEPVHAICKTQIEQESSGNNEGKFEKKFNCRVEKLLNDFHMNSDNAENCAAASMTICFLAFLSVQEFWIHDITIDRIDKLLKPVGCNCQNDKCYVKDCENGTELETEALRSEEHSIQCGILFLTAIPSLLVRYIQYYVYWCSRLRKYETCFGSVTQDMIGQLENCFEDIDKTAHDVLKEIGKLEKSEETIKNEMKRLINEKIKIAEKSEKELLKLQKISEKVQLNSATKPEVARIFKLKIEKINKTLTGNRIRCPNVLRIHKTYDEILKTNYHELLFSMKSNVDKLKEVYPKSKEIWKMKLEILEKAENIEEYRKKVEDRFLKIERNPNISMDELGEEIEKIPSDEFMEKYRKLLEENNLTD